MLPQGGVQHCNRQESKLQLGFDLCLAQGASLRKAAAAAPQRCKPQVSVALSPQPTYFALMAFLTGLAPSSPSPLSALACTDQGKAARGTRGQHFLQLVFTASYQCALRCQEAMLLTSCVLMCKCMAQGRAALLCEQSTPGAVT